MALNQEKALIVKISELRYLLSDWTVDDERTILASEPFLKPVIIGSDRKRVIKKIMHLIKKL